VGARKREKKEPQKVRGPFYLDTSGDPAPIFREGRGKPSPRKEYIEQQRDEWIWLLEPNWVDIGWILESAEKLEDVCQAFKILSARHSSALMAPFLRPTTEQSTVEIIASTRKKQEGAVIALANAEKALRTANDRHLEARRISAALAEEFRKQLEQDRSHREDRIRTLKIQKSKAKSSLRKYSLLRQKYGKRRGRDRRDFTAHLEKKLQNIERDLAADERACSDLRTRLGYITVANRRLAAEETQSRLTTVELAAKDLKEVTVKYEGLAQKLADQEAYLLRAELLEFLKARKYAAEPRQIAKALACLPYMKSRHSAELCAPLKISIPSFLNHQILQFIRSCWRRRTKRRSLSLTDWFKKEVMSLRKWIGRGKEKLKNPLRERLAKDWYFLKNAIEETLALKSGRVPKDYFIAQRFLAESLKHSPVDLIPAERAELKKLTS
jgi:hypothetical protein